MQPPAKFWENAPPPLQTLRLKKIYILFWWLNSFKFRNEQNKQQIRYLGDVKIGIHRPKKHKRSIIRKIRIENGSADANDAIGYAELRNLEHGVPWFMLRKSPSPSPFILRHNDVHFIFWKFCLDTFLLKKIFMKKLTLREIWLEKFWWEI